MPSIVLTSESFHMNMRTIISLIIALVNRVDLFRAVCYASVMNSDKELLYGMTEVGRLLGGTRQNAYLRLKSEEWPHTKEGGGIMVETSVIRQSRNLEREKLLQRVVELDMLATEHDIEDMRRRELDDEESA